jgi:hypothetical protein
MGRKNKLVLSVQVLVYALKLLLKLLDVFLRMGVHFLENGFSPLECFDLVALPRARLL